MPSLRRLDSLADGPTVPAKRKPPEAAAAGAGAASNGNGRVNGVRGVAVVAGPGAEGGGLDHGPAKRAKHGVVTTTSDRPGSAAGAEAGGSAAAVGQGSNPQQRQCDSRPKKSPTKEQKIDSFLERRMQKKQPPTKQQPKKAAEGKAAKTAKKKKKDPNAPKQPVSAYMYFCQAARRRSAGLSCQDLGDMWKQLGAAERKAYEDMNEEDKLRHMREAAAYEAGKSANHAAGELQVDRGATAAAGAGEKSSRKKKDPHAPKHPTGSYIHYQNEVRGKFYADNPGKGTKEVTALMGASWRALSDEEKRPYRDLATEEKKRYEEEMAAYNAKKLDAETKAVDETADATTGDAASDASVSFDNVQSVSFPFHRSDPQYDAVKARMTEADGGATIQNNIATSEEEDEDTVPCDLCHAPIDLWSDDIVACEHAKKCGGSFHKACLEGYGLEPEVEPFAEGCVKCRVLQKEDGVEGALQGISFVMDGKHKEHERTIRNFGGKLVGVAGLAAAAGGNTFFVVNHCQSIKKVNAALSHGIPFVGPATIRLLALGKLTVDQAQKQPRPRIQLTDGMALAAGPNGIGETPKKAAGATEDVAMDDSRMHVAGVAMRNIRAQKEEQKKGAEEERKTAAGEEKVPVVGKENRANDSAHAPDEATKSNAIGGLGKCLAAAKRQGKALAKKGKARLKKAFRPCKHSPPAKTASPPSAAAKARTANATVANLEAMKKSASKLMHPEEKKDKTSDRAEERDDLSTASSSSCDSIWEAGLHSKPKVSTSPLKHEEKSPADGGVGGGKGAKGAAAEEELDFGGNDAGGDWQPEGRDDEDVHAQAEKSSAEGDAEPSREDDDANAVAADDTPKISSPGESQMEHFGSGGHGAETQKVVNTSRVVEASIEATSKPAATVYSTQLKLVPISKAACKLALEKMGVDYTEPNYLVAGGADVYNAPREAISLEATGTKGSKAILGRNKKTGIEWSAVSRKLIEVVLEADPAATHQLPAAYLVMKKPFEDHAVFQNGTELNHPLESRVPLKDGDILSLYGPTGFAYSVELRSHILKE